MKKRAAGCLLIVGMLLLFSCKRTVLKTFVEPPSERGVFHYGKLPESSKGTVFGGFGANIGLIEMDEGKLRYDGTTALVSELEKRISESKKNTICVWCSSDTDAHILFDILQNSTEASISRLELLTASKEMIYSRQISFDLQENRPMRSVICKVGGTLADASNPGQIDAKQISIACEPRTSYSDLIHAWDQAVGSQAGVDVFLSREIAQP
jgi:hypothetical protein